ncbi:DUF7565 family protein [Natronobacterium texcoconense]|uniref:C2H2-type domain-containing protein n=1 Tax=Natronobacterium texcoconense TaxID=1095778 RepID=A0A1H1GI93_NATTX|nr:hypothetical protein [Natronobacterium texcoconense]SDR12865.1 hypothetical protein SAMN04489842_2443 [Natronobacterium texcoconense]
MVWECGIDDCSEVFADVESAVVHQATEHERLECKVCGTIVPDGYLAIRHAFSEHTRAEYVRSYGANAEDVREREELMDEIEDEADIKAIASELKR